MRHADASLPASSVSSHGGSRGVIARDSARSSVQASGIHRPLAAVASVLLLVALFRWPYDFYVFMRWAVSAIAIAIAIMGYHQSANDNEDQLWWTRVAIPCFAVIAIVFNPVAPLVMHRDSWASLDLAAAAIFATALFTRFDAPSGATMSHASSWLVRPKSACQFMLFLAVVAVLMFGVQVTSADGVYGDADCFSPLPGEC